VQFYFQFLGSAIKSRAASKVETFSEPRRGKRRNRPVSSGRKLILVRYLLTDSYRGLFTRS